MNSVITKNLGENYDKTRGKPYHELYIKQKKFNTVDIIFAGHGTCITAIEIHMKNPNKNM